MASPDMNDLVTRLKNWANVMRGQVLRGLPTRLESDLSEAATEIMRLRAALGSIKGGHSKDPQMDAIKALGPKPMGDAAAAVYHGDVDGDAELN